MGISPLGKFGSQLSDTIPLDGGMMSLFSWTINKYLKITYRHVNPVQLPKNVFCQSANCFCHLCSRVLTLQNSRATLWVPKLSLPCLAPHIPGLMRWVHPGVVRSWTAGFKLLSGCVIFGKLFNFFEPQSHYLYNRGLVRL